MGYDSGGPGGGNRNVDQSARRHERDDMTKGYKPLNLQIPDKAFANLESLRRFTGLEENAKVISCALSIYDFMWRQSNEGLIEIRMKNGIRKQIALKD